MPPFEYKPFINPYIGSISELMGKGDEAKAQALLRIGEIQARAAEQQGQAWGNAIQGLGNIAGKAFTDYAQEKKDAPIRAAEAAHREALGAADIFAAEQAVRTQALQGRQDTARELYNQRLSGTMPSPIGPVPMMRREQAPAGVAEDGTPRLPSSNLVQEPHPFQLKQNGAWVYDIEKYKQAAAAAGVAVESDPFFQAMSETNQLRQDTQAKAGVQAKQQAGLLLGMPDAQLMQNAPAAVNALRGLYNDDVLDSFMALHKSGDVPQIRAALGRLAGAVQNLKEYDPQKDLYDENTGRLVRPAAQRVQTPGEIETARHNRKLEEISTLGAGRATEMAEETARHNRVMENKGPALRGVMSSDANRLSDFDTSLDDTDVLRTVIGDTGTITRLGALMPTWVTELTGGWGEDAKSRNAVIARVKQVIGKALEGGVLRKEDEEKYKDILPTIGDPEAVALSKINGLEAAIVLRKSRLIDSLDDAGYDMQRFRARPVRVPGQTVKMRSPAPDGAIKDVPAGMVEHYKSLGATVVGP